MRKPSFDPVEHRMFIQAGELARRHARTAYIPHVRSTLEATLRLEGTSVDFSKTLDALRRSDSHWFK